MQKPDVLDLRSQSVLEAIQKRLRDLCPESISENGRIDFDRLKLSLGEAVDVGRERYSVNWPGKADCFRTIQTPSLGTLRPSPDESVNFDTTQNLIIEGDNLEVLKLLQKSYLGTVKMIYIDPPYNTGSDFIYPDNYSESLQTYLDYTGQSDSDGKNFCSNTEVSGRFHSNWLNMMYPRLYLARNLLREDGAMFISIDDHEVHTLRRVCDEIFGEDNFVCTFIWEKRYAPPPDTKEVGYVHENILFYRKTDKYSMGLLPLGVAQKSRYKNPDKDSRGLWKAMDYSCRYTKSERPNLYYEIVNPNTGKGVWPKETRVWAFSSDMHDKNEREKRIWWGTTGKANVPSLKNFLSEIKQGMMPTTLLKQDVVGTTHEATKELRGIIPDLKYTPKPVRLLKHLAAIANLNDTDTVFDFFAGSGTTALAVLALNREDGGRRKFLMIQFPEPTGRDDLPTIADIMKRRIGGTIQKLTTEPEGKASTGSTVASDLGYRVFTLADSNFESWIAEASDNAEELVQQLELHINHIRAGRTTTDLLFEILLKSGFTLTTQIDSIEIGGGRAYSVSSGALLICLEHSLTMEMIEAMAEKGAERVVCLDKGFAGDDQLKANALQMFKNRGVTSVRTV